MKRKAPLFLGTIDGTEYYDADYVNKIISLIENNDSHLLNLESHNLLDILTRKKDSVILVVGKSAFFEKAEDYFLDNRREIKFGDEIYDRIIRIRKISNT